jgi:hypothetical protein
VGIRIGTNTASNHSGSNLYETLSTIYTATNITHSVNIIDARASNWTAVEVQSVMAYDLTLAMGLGNEPTATEMDAILTADGTAYWEGTKQVLCNPDNKYYWKDYSGNGRHMKLNNFAYSGASGWQSPYGLQFDKVDDFGTCYGIPITETTPISIVCNTKLIGETTGDSVMLGYGLPGTAGAFAGIYARATTSYFRFSGWKESAPAIDYDTSFAKDNKTHFWVITFDGSNVTVYRDGIIDSVGVKAAAINFGTSPLFTLGRGNAANYSNEKSFLAGIFNKVLSPNEVRKLYEANKRRFVT